MDAEINEREALARVIGNPLREEVWDAADAILASDWLKAHTAGADAERARVVAWLREHHARVRKMRAEALDADTLADAIERGEHWESGDGQN